MDIETFRLALLEGQTDMSLFGNHENGYKKLANSMNGGEMGPFLHSLMPAEHLLVLAPATEDDIKVLRSAEGGCAKSSDHLPNSVGLAI